MKPKHFLDQSVCSEAVLSWLCINILLKRRNLHFQLLLALFILNVLQSP